MTHLEMIAYLTECTLATVERMRGLKSKSKGEFNRQCSIAAKGITHLQWSEGAIDAASRCPRVKEYLVLGVPNRDHGALTELIVNGINT